MLSSALILEAMLAAPGQDVSTLSVPASPSIVSGISFEEDQRRPQGEGERRRTGERPHTVGLGGQVGISNRGAGGGTRFFFGNRFGVNFDMLWYRGSGTRYTSNPQQGSTFAAMPSFIYMLTKPNLTRDVDVRPYVGGGVNYVRSTRPVTTTGGSTTTLQRRSGTGGQVFGGVEMTFAEADWMTISAEGIYYKLPINYVNASIVGGFNYLLAFHFYLR